MNYRTKPPTPPQSTTANELAAYNEVVNPTGSAVTHTADPDNNPVTIFPLTLTPDPITAQDSTSDDLTLPAIQEGRANNGPVYAATYPAADSNIDELTETISMLISKTNK